MSWLLLLGACADRSYEAAPASSRPADEEAEFGWSGSGEGGGGRADAPAAPPPPGAARGEAKPTSSSATAKMRKGLMAETDDAERDAGGKDQNADSALEAAEAAPTRAWFPESFLWQPLLEVPESGTVTVSVPVPDTLTTWRLLALGQTRQGAQAGAVTTFISTLPAYVDLVTPAFLWAGDSFTLPVQAVSQQGDPISAALQVTANGQAIGGGSVALAAYGSRTENVNVRAARAGELTLGARFGTFDSVEKVVPVRPVGRPVDQSRGGTLAGPRTFSLSVSGVAEPGGLVVTAFPGALGVARAELAAAPSRGDDLASAAYTYALTGMAAPLVDEGAVTADVLRATQLRAWQRIARATRSPGVEDSATTLLGVRLAPGDSLAGRLAVRVADSLRNAQAADGLWTMSGTSNIDAALVQTARSVWALGPSNQANRLRATGAFERHRERLGSPYIAAWALAAGVVDEGRVEELRKTVRDALGVRADGARTLRVDASRPDRRPVPEAEATALAILALPADDPARSDLAGGLLGLYTPGGGFGDGWTSLVAVHALESVFAGDIPREVTVRVEVDGVEVGRAVLDPNEPHAPVHLAVPSIGKPGLHTVVVSSEPAVPGLAFTAVAREYLPWVQSAPAGLDVSVVRPDLRVGQPARVAVSASGPVGMALDVGFGLPAGVDPDRAALDLMVMTGGIGAWRAEEGRLTLLGVRTEGGAWSGTVPVTPTLAGGLLADAAVVYPSGDPSRAFTRVPERWTIR